jgi:PDZ domain-containing protein
MKRYLFSLSLLIFQIACSRPFMPVQNETTPPSAAFSYCDLLHVQPFARPAMEPKPYLGIYMAPKKPEHVEQACAGGNFVQAAGIIKGSPAWKAGIRIDDVVLSLGGSPVCGDAGQIILSFKKMIEAQETGTPIALEVLRDREKISLPVVLERRPIHEQPEAEHPGIDKCSGRVSLLEQALRSHDAVPGFFDLADGLRLRSMAVHNPGSDPEKGPHPLQLNEVTYLMRHPLLSGIVAKALSERMSAPFDDRNWQGSDLLIRAAALLDIAIPPGKSPAEASFPALLRVMEETKKRIDDALENLTPGEKDLVREKAFDPADDDQWNRVLEISLKVDRSKMLNALAPLFVFLTQDNLLRLKKDLHSRFEGIDKPVLYETMTSFGKVVVGGTGPNTYRENAALILDLGGDDLYLNNAGGTRPKMPLSLVIDWGGDDRYLGQEDFSQGAGLLGAGMLLDLGGKDTFISRDGSQGAGFWGLGFLYHGAGKATFRARKFSQGTAQMGMGILINAGKDDRYLCSYGGQGLGLFGGAGILIDQAGDDLYQLGGLEPDFRDPRQSTQSYGQGFGMGARPDKEKNGVPGGIGMLIDKQGDDAYLADYFSQGASYYYGLGILDDRSGNDQYFSGRYSQGAGIHSSVGVLVDRGGDDLYYSSFGVSQGMGHDFGVGVLEDAGGEDHYQGGTLVQGAATSGGLGILLDPSGADRLSHTGIGQGQATDETGMGIMISTGRPGHAPAVTIGRGKE